MGGALRGKNGRRFCRTRVTIITLNATQPVESVPVRFARVASQFAGRIAISAPGLDWTYTELDRRSSFIAAKILEHSGHSPAPVALLMDHGAPLIATILGALKAGKMYFVLETSHPLAATLTDSGTHLLFTDENNFSLAHPLSSNSLKIIELPPDIPAGFSPAQLPEIPLHAGAWLMYTSGSTGVSKSIWENHAGIVRHSDVYRDLVQLTPEDRLTLLTPCGLSASGTHLFSALLHGATLCPFPARQSADRLAAWLRERRITIYHSVPTIFRHLAASESAKKAFETVRLVRLGGEPLLRSDIESFRRLCPAHCQLMNSFSSTETGLVTTFSFDVQRSAFDVRRSRTPVGRPVPGVEVLLLDEQNQPVAPGAEGRIAVRSAHLRQGYWREPALTAEKFRTDPVHPGLRTFITADLGKWLPDGSLEHLGRADYVVKIQGQRVDLHAVESALMTTGLVSEVVVTAPEDAAGECRLAAYFVPRDGADVSPQNLRAQLRAQIPEHFVPSHFVPLSKMPQTPGGKIYRPGLPPLPKTPRAELDAATAPQNSIEKKLAFIWESILGVSPIGRCDDFFELGGTSLKMVEVGAAIEEYFNLVLSSSTLVAHSTIEKLAPLLSPSIAVASPRPLVTLRSAPQGRPLFLIHSGLGEVVTYGLLVRKLSARPVYGLQAPGVQGECWPLLSIPKMADRYLPEILERDPTGPYLLGGTCMGGMVAFELAQRLVRMGRHVSLLALIDSPAAPYTGRRARWHELALDPLRDTLRIIRWRILRLRGLKVRQLHAYRRFVAAMTELANRHYHPQFYPGTLTLLLTTDTQYRFEDRRKVMNQYARETRICSIAGTRTGLFMHPQVNELARQLQACLDAADANSATGVSPVRPHPHLQPAGATTPA
jgi:amino acid adenylation domain-containing protein